MNLDTLVTLLVGGMFSAVILSIIFAPDSPAAAIIDAIGKSLGNVATASKSIPR